MLCVMAACHAHSAIFFFLRSFCYFFSFFLILFFNFHFSLNLFLICSYFLGDLSLTVLIKCVLNKKKCICYKNLFLLNVMLKTAQNLRTSSDIAEVEERRRIFILDTAQN